MTTHPTPDASPAYGQRPGASCQDGMDPDAAETFPLSRVRKRSRPARAGYP